MLKLSDAPETKRGNGFKDCAAGELRSHATKAFDNVYRPVVWGRGGGAAAVGGGVIAGAVGRTDIFVSGGAEHQGPDGGGPVAVVARRS